MEKLLTLLLLITLVSIASCEEHNYYEYDDLESEDEYFETKESYVTPDECVVLPPSKCVGDTLITYERHNDCVVNATIEDCEYGCIDIGNGGESRCLDACEINPCDKPEPRCESMFALIEFNHGTCVLRNTIIGYECIENPYKRTPCKDHCVKSANGHKAHCIQ